MLSYKTLILCVTVFIWLNVVPVLGDGQQSFKDTKVKVKAFNCEHEEASVTKISLKNMKPCSMSESKKAYRSPKNVTAQFLYKADSERITVDHCSFKYRLKYQACSHASYHYLYGQQTLEYGSIHLTELQCQQAVKDNILQFSYNQKVYSSVLDKQGTSNQLIFLAGKMQDHYCKGESSLQWRNITFYRGVLYMETELTIIKTTADYYYNSDTPYQFSYKGLTYVGKESMVVTGSDLGTLLFGRPKTLCAMKIFMNSTEGLLYEATSNSSDKIIVVTTEDRTVSLPLKSELQTQCGYRVYESHLDSLFVLLDDAVDAGQLFAASLRSNIELYGNQYNLFVSHELDLDQSFQDTAFRLCENRRKLLQNSLDMAAIDPGSIRGLGNLVLNRNVGVKGIRNGGVMYMISCVEVNVTVAQINFCCQEIPVNHEGSLMFADPLSYTLEQNCSYTECSTHLPTIYELEDNSVLCATPTISYCPNEAPLIIDPNSGAKEDPLFDGTDRKAYSSILGPVMIIQLHVASRFISNRKGFWSMTGWANGVLLDSNSDMANKFNMAMGEVGVIVDYIKNPGLSYMKSIWIYHESNLIIYISFVIFTAVLNRMRIMFSAVYRNLRSHGASMHTFHVFLLNTLAMINPLVTFEVYGETSGSVKRMEKQSDVIHHTIESPS